MITLTMVIQIDTYLVMQTKTFVIAVARPRNIANKKMWNEQEIHTCKYALV